MLLLNNFHYNLLVVLCFIFSLVTVNPLWRIHWLYYTWYRVNNIHENCTQPVPIRPVPRNRIEPNQSSIFKKKNKKTIVHNQNRNNTISTFTVHVMVSFQLEEIISKITFLAFCLKEMIATANSEIQTCHFCRDYTADTWRRQIGCQAVCRMQQTRRGPGQRAALSDC